MKCEKGCVRVSSEYTLKISEERAKEMPMVDLAFEVLKAANTPFYYRDLMQEIAKIKGLSDEEVKKVIAQLYTEINIDGRFACVGSNLWGLKRWYPVDKSEDAVAGGKRPRIINDDDDDLDEEDVFSEEEDVYDEDAETDYDGFDDELDDFAADEDEEFLDEEDLGAPVIDEELEEAEEALEDLEDEEEDLDELDDEEDAEEEDDK